uniref:Uncharacterized protein n=1 Tax=Myoviridae sp. ctncN39 TaxID=2825170 RepID=A0A8S5V2A0_9CAUD|nr:MAG TPA: hypothetical protein [Myoviridae sp. ctncN39]
MCLAEEITKHCTKNRRKNRHKDLLKGCLAVISPLFKHKITVVSQHIVTAERAGADLHFFIVIAAPKRIYFLLRDFFNQAEIFKMSQVIANLPALLWMQQRDKHINRAGIPMHITQHTDFYCKEFNIHKNPPFCFDCTTHRGF